MTPACAAVQWTPPFWPAEQLQPWQWLQCWQARAAPLPREAPQH